MPRFYYMLQKELIEFKLVSRVPLALFLFGMVMLVSIMYKAELQQDFIFRLEFADSSTNISSAFAVRVDLVIASLSYMVSLILFSLYMPRTFRKERREGSSMFWRSMPVTYGLTHTVKLCFGLFVIPLICSILVFQGNLFLWLLNMETDYQLSRLIHQDSFSVVIMNWLEYLGRALLSGLALLPLATITLMTSQLFSTPVIVMVLSGYAVKWTSSYLFDYEGVSLFFAAIIRIPATVFSPQPFSGFIEAGVINLAVYYLLGVAALAISLYLSKTNEASLKTLIGKD